MRLNQLIAALAVGACLSFASSAQAVTITPTDILASSGFGAPDPDFLIDGTGLIPGNDSDVTDDTHGNNDDASGMWLSGGDDTDGGENDEFLIFDLGGLFNLTEALVWNHNQAGNTNLGVDTMNIYATATGTSVNDASGFALITATNLSQGSGLTSETAQTTSLSGPNAQNVRFVMFTDFVNFRLSGSLSGTVGLSEVRFTDTPRGTSCVRDNLTACLLGGSLIANARGASLGEGRFEVTVTMRDFANPPSGPGDIFPGMIQFYNGESSETTQAVNFYSFQFGNVEIFVKMVDACTSGFNSFWVFAAGATTAKTVILIRDTWTDQVYRIDNPRGQDFFFAPDTQAFKTCDASPPPG